MFDADKHVLRRAGTDQFVKLGLNGGAVPILGILDQKHHEEGHNGRACVHDELPGVGKPEERSAQSPSQDGQEANRKGNWPASDLSDPIGEIREPSGGGHSVSLALSS